MGVICSCSSRPTPNSPPLQTERDQGSGMIRSPAAIALLKAAGNTGVVSIDESVSA